MKKFLSLVLALVMTMSLVTVSAGAKDFGDSADLSGEAYEEAVNVMSEMGIIDGYSSCPRWGSSTVIPMVISVPRAP